MSSHLCSNIDLHLWASEGPNMGIFCRACGLKLNDIIEEQNVEKPVGEDDQP